jgi:transcriptional regulator with XRE-family HTH domain
VRARLLQHPDDGMMTSAQNPFLLQAMAAEIKSRRTALGMTQDDLAKSARLNRTYVAKLETAKNQPSITALLKLSRGLETTPEELMTAVMVRYEDLTRS